MDGPEERHLLPCDIFSEEHFHLLVAQGIPHDGHGIQIAGGDEHEGFQRMPYQNHALVGSAISKGVAQVVQLYLPPKFWWIGIRVLFGMKPGISNKLSVGIVDGYHNTIPHHAFATVVPYAKGGDDIFVDSQGLHERMTWIDVLETKGEGFVL